MDDRYNRIARWIEDGDFDDAAQLLEEIPRELREPEWHYLNGRILEHRGFFSDARISYKTASNAAPEVLRYKDALVHLEAAVGASDRPNNNGKQKQGKRKKGCCCCNIDTSDGAVGECCLECSCACCCESICEGLGDCG